MKSPRFLILGAVAGAVLFGVGVLAIRHQQNRFQATTRFEIHASKFLENMFDGPTSSEWFEIQFKRLTATNVLLMVVKNCGLDKKWNLEHDAATMRLERMIEVEQEHGTGIAKVTARSSEADEAVAIANGIREAYGQWRHQFEQERNSRLARNVDAQIKIQEERVEKARKEEMLDPPSNKEYQTRTFSYKSQLQLLNAMREHGTKKRHEAANSKSVKVPEEAVARPAN